MTSLFKKILVLSLSFFIPNPILGGASLQPPPANVNPAPLEAENGTGTSPEEDTSSSNPPASSSEAENGMGTSPEEDTSSSNPTPSSSGLGSSTPAIMGASGGGAVLLGVGGLAALAGGGTASVYGLKKWGDARDRTSANRDMGRENRETEDYKTLEGFIEKHNKHLKKYREGTPDGKTLKETDTDVYGRKEEFIKENGALLKKQREEGGSQPQGGEDKTPTDSPEVEKSLSEKQGKKLTKQAGILKRIEEEYSNEKEKEEAILKELDKDHKNLLKKYLIVRGLPFHPDLKVRQVREGYEKDLNEKMSRAKEELDNHKEKINSDKVNFEEKMEKEKAEFRKKLLKSKPDLPQLKIETPGQGEAKQKNPLKKLETIENQLEEHKKKMKASDKKVGFFRKGANWLKVGRNVETQTHDVLKEQIIILERAQKIPLTPMERAKLPKQGRKRPTK